jgi:hypothetical protein
MRQALRGLCSALLLAAVLLLATGTAAAQETFSPVIDLDSNAPEAWALRYFTSASLFTGAGPAERRAPGALDFSLETIWVPELDKEQRTVGYGGTKEEELNRSPVWARLRARVALPAGWELEAGYIPPLEIDGVKANLFALSIGRQLLASGNFALGLRLHAQRGKAKGDFTCKEGKDHLFPVGSPQNPFGCEAPSKDEVSLDSTGLELTGSWDLEGKAPTLHAAVSYNRMDVEFQVDALTFGIHDRSLLKNEGDVVTFATGATWSVFGRSSLGFEVLYAPLDIKRRNQEEEEDSLLHARALLRVPLR